MFISLQWDTLSNKHALISNLGGNVIYPSIYLFPSENGCSWTGRLPRKQYGLQYLVFLGMSLPEEMNGWFNRIPEKNIQLCLFPSWAPPALSPLHGGCLSLPLTVWQVLSLTPSGYFCFAPSHCLIHFQVKNMISKCPTSFFWSPCGPA